MKKLLVLTILLAGVGVFTGKITAQDVASKFFEKNGIKAYYLMSTHDGGKFSFVVSRSTNFVGDVLKIESLVSNKLEQAYFLDDSYTFTSMSRLTGGQSEVITTWSSGSGCRTYIFGGHHGKIEKLLYVESKLEPEVVLSARLHILFSNTYGEYDNKEKWETTVYDEIDGHYKKHGTVPYLKRFNGLE